MCLSSTIETILHSNDLWIIVRVGGTNVISDAQAIEPMLATTTTSCVHTHNSIKYIDVTAQGQPVRKNRAALAHQECSHFHRIFSEIAST